MKNYNCCSVLIPGHSLDDFPTHHLGNDAESLLASWSAVWHPALIASSGKAPRWLRAGIDEIESEQQLVIVPRVACHALNEKFMQSANRHAAVVIRHGEHESDTRSVLIERAITSNAAAQAANQKIDSQLANDFLALGFAYLQVQIMTRQLRYSSNLNEPAFNDHLVTAAIAAAAGQPDSARRELTVCFDLLSNEKNNYYPVQPKLLDLVLVAETTLGKSLTQQLDVSHAFNLLLTGNLATRLADTNAPAIVRIRELLDRKQVAIVGGLQAELPDPLLSTETTIRQLAQGRQAITKTFGTQPSVFFRRRFGLSPSLPGLLEQFDFAGAIHATLDDGKVPIGSSSNIRWTGIDTQSISALGYAPHSATDSGALLRLGLSIGEQIDSAHVATMVFAHWPGRVCESFQDLLRCNAYGSLFGRFIHFEDYFETVYDPGFGDTFNADDYRSPYLQQAITSQQLNPLSRIADYWSVHYQLSSCRALLVQSACLSRQLAKSGSSSPTDSTPWSSWIAEIETLETRLDQQTDATDPAGLQNLMPEIAALRQQVKTGWPTASSAPESTRRCVVNTSNAKRRLRFTTPASSSLTRKDIAPSFMADSGQQQTDWIVEVAGNGFVEFSIQPTGTRDVLRAEPAVLIDNLLRNEYFELQVDQVTGGIRSVQLHGGRQNLISQQLAVRISNRRSTDERLSTARYTTMVVDGISTSNSSRLAGSITTHGRLVDGQIAVANFQQSVSLSRGVPIADLDIEIELIGPWRSDFNHYVCNRLAWKEESAQVIANDQEARQFVAADWFQATNFIAIEQADQSVTLLTGGLPFHRRVSRRMIDSLLIVGNEQRRQFRLGLGVDLRYPMMAAKNWMTPIVNFDSVANGQLADERGWLFHFDCKNILITWWQPVFDSNSQISGVQIRCRETEGRAGQLTIRCLLPIVSAARVNLAGVFLRALDLESTLPNQATVEFSGNECFQVSINL